MSSKTVYADIDHNKEKGICSMKWNNYILMDGAFYTKDGKFWSVLSNHFSPSINKPLISEECIHTLLAV